MNGRQARLTFQVGCAYVGTVVGAGFASGQEIFQFFGRYGLWAIVTIPASGVLFAWLGYRALMLGSQLRATSYREFTAHLFGREIARWVDAALLVMLFGVSVAMVAGAGELFRQQLGLSFQIGAVVSLCAAWWTIVRGMRGLLRANAVIVPIMITFLVWAAARTALTDGWRPVVQTALALSHRVPVGGAIVSTIIYAAMNIGLAAGVLVPLGSAVEDLRVLRRGATFGALGLVVMQAAVIYVLLSHYPAILTYPIPMAYATTQFGHVVGVLFVFVLWAEIYTTLVGDIYAITAPVAHRWRRSPGLVAGVFLGAAYACSQIGFTNLIKYGYTAFGWVSLLLLIALAWPSRRSPVV